MNRILQRGPNPATIAGVPRPFRQKARAIITALIAFAAMPGLPAHATTRNVPTGYATIGAAVSAAASGDTILVDDGAYSAQNILTNKVLTIKSVNGPANTIVNCGGNYFGTYQGSGTLIQGFTFQNSTSSLGVIAFQTSAGIDNCIFKNNNSGFNFSPACINTAGTSNTVNITNCSFDHNTGLGALQFNSKVVISDSTFTSNTGQFGSGAIYANTATGQITRCSFSGNRSDTNDQGGAIYWVNGALTCTDCSFTNNSSGAAGGAIEVGAQGLDSPLILMNCLFAGNSAPKGGALSDSVSSNHTCSITATNCLFVGNTASSNGAAIDSTGSAVPVSMNVTNCSFYGNSYTGASPSAQGAISADGSTAVSITNTILYGDPTPREISTLSTPGSITVQFTDINQSGFAGSGNINSDPQYLDPVNGDLRITAASPAALSGTATGAPTTDYNGVTRPTPPSMGAFEPIITPTHFVVTLPSTTVSSSALTITVTAEDDNGKTATDYNGTVTFTSSDTAFVNPGPITLTSGTGSIGTAVLNTAGSQTITATDGTLTGTGSTTVLAGPASTLSITAPASVTAGTPFNVTVDAFDLAGNAATAYTGTIHFTNSDGGATLPADTTLTNGTGTFSVTLVTAVSQTLTVTDTPNGLTASASTTVNGGAATHFTVSGPANTTTGNAFNITVVGIDAYGNVSNIYAGTVHFTSTDGAASLPADATLTNGAGTFSATLNTAGNQTITATDTVTFSITGTSNAIAVSQATVTHFGLSAPASAMAGDTVTFTVSALDALNHIVPGYTGTVRITASDGHASLPANSKLTNGVKTFSVVLRTAMNTAVTATDTVNASITGTATVAVSAGPATRFRINLRGNAVAGSPYAGNVQATDLYGNAITSYNGTVHFTSTDGAATLPADTTLTNGAANFNATLYTVGSQTLTVTDTVTPSMTSTSVPFSVVAGPVTHFGISAPASATVAGTFSVTVTALDSAGNVVPSYTGTVRFTSTDGHAVLPVNSTLTNGVKTFNVTMRTSGSQTVTATDTVKASITGTATITVAPAAPARFRINLRGNPKAGTPYQFSVQATDIYGNATPTYSGTVHFTSTDGAATLPADTTLSGGIGYFAATFRTVGSQTFTLTDTVNASITSTSAVLTVAP